MCIENVIHFSNLLDKGSSPERVQSESKLLIYFYFILLFTQLHMYKLHVEHLGMPLNLHM